MLTLKHALTACVEDTKYVDELFFFVNFTPNLCKKQRISVIYLLFHHVFYIFFPAGHVQVLRSLSSSQCDTSSPTCSLGWTYSIQKFWMFTRTLILVDLSCSALGWRCAIASAGSKEMKRHRHKNGGRHRWRLFFSVPNPSTEWSPFHFWAAKALQNFTAGQPFS